MAIINWTEHETCSIINWTSNQEVWHSKKAILLFPGAFSGFKDYKTFNFLSFLSRL